ncbi:YxeA family protein [Oenococcus oeni]
MKNKKSHFKLTKIIALLIPVFILTTIFSFRNPLTDRYNPFLNSEQSYAKVKKGTQKYRNVTAYTEQGRKLSYTLDFCGYDPDEQYVKITHKGKYVKRVIYVQAKNAPRKVR